MAIADLVSPRGRKPFMGTILSDAGLGKTSAAAKFPKPIFIRIEDGLTSIPDDWGVDAFPLVESTSDLFDVQLMALLTEDHKYRTVVFDSVTSLERLFIDEIIERDPKKPRSLNQALGGYGAGTSALAAMHQRVRKAAGVLQSKKNMNVVFLAHADTEQLELPDSDPYTRYNLRLSKKSVAPYVDDVDLVGFIKLKTFFKGSEDNDRKRAISDGSRVMVCHASAANISKNRYGITQEIPVVWGENPLKDYVIK